jgi:Tfp pilus assembly protein PilN
MLRQEINLYRSFQAPKTGASLLTWKRYWLSNLLVVIIMGMIGISTIIGNYVDEGILEKNAHELAQLKDDFMKLKSSFPQLFFSENITDAVNNFKKEMAVQQELIAMLAKRTPFSADLIGLSRSIHPDVWLKKIMIQKSGNDITLEGESIGMTNLNEFLANLDKDPIYKDYAIVINEIKNKNVSDPTNPLNFEIVMTKHEL